MRRFPPPNPACRLSPRLGVAALLVGLALGAGAFPAGQSAAQAPSADDVVLIDAAGGTAGTVAALDDGAVAAGIGARVFVLDVTDRTAPRIVGRSGLLPASPLDLAAGGRAAFAALGGAGLAVIDLDDRTAPRLAARLCLPRPPVDGALAMRPPRPRASAAACADAGSPPIQAVAVAADGLTAFAVGGGGVLVVDAADPYRPRDAGWLPLGVDAVAVAALDGTVLVLGSVPAGPDAGNRLIVVDTHDVEQPAVRSWLKLGGPVGAFVDVAAAGSVAVAGGLAGAAVIDLARLDRPNVAARIDRTVSAVDVRSSGDRTLAALVTPNVADDPQQRAVFHDIDLFDISTRASPRRLGRHATATFVSPTDIVLGPITSDAPWLVLSSALGGCTVLEHRQPASITAVGEVMSGGAIRVAAGGGHAFVIEGDPRGATARQRLAIVDVATGAPVGSIAGLTHVQGLTAAGDRLYIVEGNGGVRIVSTTVISAPQTIGYITDVHTGMPPAAGPGWIAIVGTDNAVHVMDARDPAHIRTVSALSPSTPVIVDVAAIGHRLLVAGSDRLFAFDLSDPTQPRPIGQTLFDTEDARFVAPRLAVGDGRAWLVDPLGGLFAFDARPDLPRRIARFADVAGLDVVDVGGRAIVRLARPDAASGHMPGDRLVVVDAPLGGGGGIVGTWTAPADALDAAADPVHPGGILVAAGAYGLTRWQRRADVAPTATPTEAPARPAPTRTTRTAAPPDPARARRVFLPLVTNGLAGAKPAVTLSLAATLGGVAASAAADVDIGYVAYGVRVTSYRLRGSDRRMGEGPEPLGSATVGERIIALAVTRGRLAALVGPPRALEPVTLAFGGFGIVAGGGNEPDPAAHAIPAGDGTGLRLLDVTDPSRPRLAARVALPPGAIDVTAGSNDTAGWFAVVGATGSGGYLVTVDARNAAVPESTRLDLGDVRPVGVAVTGRRAVVQLSRADASAVLLVHLDRPDRPAPGGTTGGLAPAIGVGGVAAARDRAFVLTTDGLSVIEVTGREPRVVGETSVGFNGGEPAFVAAVGSNVWVGSRQGEVLQMFVVEDSPNVFNFDQLPYVDAVGLGRTMAAGNGVLLFAGGMLGSVAAAKMPLFDPGNGDFEDDEGTVFEGEVAGLGYSAAVAAGPPGTGLAFATTVNGSIGPVRTRPSDGEPTLGTAFGFRDISLPRPPTDLAMRGAMGVLVGGLTPLRTLQVLGELVAPVAEPLDTSSGTPLDGLRAAPTARRIVLADGFAWVAERNAGFTVFDISDPRGVPLRAGRVETPGQPRGLAVREGRVYVADGTAGLTLINARNPASPRESGHLSTPGIVSAVALSADGRTAFIAVDSIHGAWLGSGRDRAAVWAVDVQNMAAPRVIGAAGLDMGTVADMKLDGNRLYVVGQRVVGGPMAEPPGGTLSAAVVDATDPTRPALTGQWTAATGFPYVPSVLSVVGSRVVVALGEGGVAVLDVR
ncbi:MAG: hypothetical protein IT332_13725 [Ardenticatenales bacterium]|nr:hypothetical protein [Ardenticatenales bacterium]